MLGQLNKCSITIITQSSPRKNSVNRNGKRMVLFSRVVWTNQLQLGRLLFRDLLKPLPTVCGCLQGRSTARAVAEIGSGRPLPPSRQTMQQLVCARCSRRSLVPLWLGSGNRGCLLYLLFVRCRPDMLTLSFGPPKKKTKSNTPTLLRHKQYREPAV